MSESNIASSLSILIGSLNTHRLYPPPDINLSSWLTYKSSTPHIVAIGLQELPFTYSFLQQKSDYQWKELIEKTLPNYQLLSSVRLNGKTILSFVFCQFIIYSLGLILFIYVQSSHVNQCSSIATANVPTVRLNIN